MNGCVAQWGGWCKGGILLPQCGYISLVNYKKDFLFFVLFAGSVVMEGCRNFFC